MSSKNGHFGDKKLDKLHVAVDDTTENGACLTGHEMQFDDFKKKVTCNYRYQAYEQAKSNAGIKDRLHGYTKSTASLGTSAYDTRAGGHYPSWYTEEIAGPDPANEDWHIGGPKTPKARSQFKGGSETIPATKNFTNARWPYWNNAHHLIPKGTLKSTIQAEKGEVPNLIQKALLEAKYNVNHKINMLLMPQDQEVARVLKLPRHIQLKDDDEPDLEAACMDHPVYNAMVTTMKSGLSDIIKDYRKICEDAEKKAKDENHEVPNAQLDKAKLEKLSETLLKILLDWGSASAGKSIDALSKGAASNGTAVSM